MKVKIGPYVNWIGPYQIAEELLFWLDRDHELVDRFGDWLAGPDDRPSVLLRFCQWVHDRRQRTVKVKIDPWDTWSMDHTLAHIILPMLRQLRDEKHGSPQVPDSDVPRYLRSTSTSPRSGVDEDADRNLHQRWDWILGEMIWTFEQLVKDDWTDQYYTVQADGKKDWDKKAYTKGQRRLSRGLMFFGRYYQSLWD